MCALCVAHAHVAPSAAGKSHHHSRRAARTRRARIRAATASALARSASILACTASSCARRYSNSASKVAACARASLREAADMGNIIGDVGHGDDGSAGVCGSRLGHGGTGGERHVGGHGNANMCVRWSKNLEGTKTQAQIERGSTNKLWLRRRGGAG